MARQGKTLPYLTAEELRGEGCREVREELEKHSGPGAFLGVPVLLAHINSSGRKDVAQVRVLDAGTASGFFCLELFRSGFREIASLDIADYRAREVKDALCIRDAKYADMSLDPLPWPAGHFDAVTAWCVLPHLENPFHFVREVQRVLAPGGLFLLSMPHVNSIWMRKRFLRTGDIERYHARNNHLVIFTPAIFEKTVLRYFKIVEVLYWIDIEKLSKSRFGWLKSLLVTRSSPWRERLRSWFGTEIIYVLKKPESAS